MNLLDHKVTYRPEYVIAKVAAACRKIGTPIGSYSVNLKTILDELQAHGVESIYKLRGAKTKGKLRIELVDDTERFPAWVEFSPRLTLFVKRSVWQRFLDGYSKEREIIAHEIGHIMLHDDTAMPFVGDKSQYLKFTGSEEDFAEWQADTFAEHILIPDEIIQKHKNPEKVSFLCNVEEGYADERIGKFVLASKSITTVFDQDPCPDCGNFSFSTLKNPPKCSVCSFSPERKNAV